MRVWGEAGVEVLGLVFGGYAFRFSRAALASAVRSFIPEIRNMPVFGVDGVGVEVLGWRLGVWGWAFRAWRWRLGLRSSGLGVGITP